MFKSCKCGNLSLRISLAIGTILILLVCLSPLCYASNWYVDNAATGSNKGTSWTNAWKSFSDMRWGSGGVTAGDILYISGGSIEKTYHEQLTIGASGSSGQPITIRGGLDSGHAGTVIIDGSGEGPRRDYCVDIRSCSYVTIHGLTCKNAYNIGIGGENGHDVTIERCTITACGHGGENDQAGIRYFGSSGNILVDHCTLYDMKSDGIICGWVKDSSISNCNVTDYAGATTVDGIQVSGTNIIIESNVVHGMLNLVEHSDGIIIEPPSNGVTIRYNTVSDCLQNMYIDSYYYGEGSKGITDVQVYYNNVYKVDYTNDVHGIHFHANDVGPSPITGVKAYNNTIAYKTPASGDTGLSFNAVTDGDARNNILYNACLLKFNNADMHYCNYNNYYRTDSGDIISWEENSFTSLETLKTVNPTYEINGQQKDPLFVDVSSSNHKLQDSSPCIDKGTNVGLSRDMEGKHVPKGSADMGAFEYYGKHARPTPPTELWLSLRPSAPTKKGGIPYVPDPTAEGERISLPH